MMVKSACRVFCYKLVNQITKTINAESFNSVMVALFALFAGMFTVLRRREDQELSFAF